MKPVKQTTFLDKAKGTRGNCLSACLASILELGIEEVPHFAEQAEWQESLFKWLARHGLELENQNDAPNGLAIAIGYSPREIRHAIVVNNGVMVWDPHPDNNGLVSIQCYWTLQPLSPVKAMMFQAELDAEREESGGTPSTPTEPNAAES